MKLKENSVFTNRYELHELLGRGAFSETWLVKDLWTHHNNVIKVYFPELGMDEDGMNDFCGELAQVYDVNHPNLLKPQHVDVWNNMPYLIMVYRQNGSCAKMVGKATEEQMWKIIQDVAAGLVYLHEKGVVHQNIKPANILIDEDGRYQITDFGVPSRSRNALRKREESSTGGETMAYMSPEQFLSQPVPTKASDVWSFGAMCFELVEGYVPFGDNGGLSQKIGADLPLISSEVSEALKFVITKMLQKEHSDRPSAATLMEWAAAPQRIKIENTIQEGRPVEKRNGAVVADTEIRETSQQEEPVSKNEKDIPAKKVKAFKWIVAGVAAILIVVICWFAYENNETEECSEEAPEVSDEIFDTEEEQDAEVIVNIDTLSFTVNGVSFTMIKVDGGTFQMGTNEKGRKNIDSRPAHSVTLSSYYIGKTEVTRALWRTVMDNNSFQGDDNLPINDVSWNGCQDFIRKLNQLTGRQFALPTEAQWEFAARGGNFSRGYEYSGSDNLGRVAWYKENSSYQIHPVGTKKANELGIYDMSGNVSEWCQDWMGQYNRHSETNPVGPSEPTAYGEYRVCRGGGVGDEWLCRSASREMGSSGCGSHGLRLVLFP